MQLQKKMSEISDLKFAILLCVPVIVFLLAIVVYPLAYTLVLSFYDIGFFGGIKTEFVDGKHYFEIISSESFLNALLVSLRFTAESVVLTLLIGLGIALILSKHFRGKKLVRSLVILPWAVSSYSLGIMYKYLWKGHTSIFTAIGALFGSQTAVEFVNERNVIEVLAVGNAWNLAPLVAFFLLASIETIPTRLYDLAEIDQMTKFGKFFHVTLPYLRITLWVFTAIMSVISLKVFDYIYVQTGGGPGTASATLTYEIYKNTFLGMNFGFGAALSFYLLLLIIIITIMLYLFWGKRELAKK
jgi:multiple sugar transport system permease protein